LRAIAAAGVETAAAVFLWKRRVALEDRRKNYTRQETKGTEELQFGPSFGVGRRG